MKLLEDVKLLLKELETVRTRKVDIPGELKVRRQDGVLRYYQRFDTSEKYLGKGEVETIRCLEKKHYYSELGKVVENEKTALVRVAKILENTQDYREVFLNIPVEKRHLITPYEIIPDKEEINAVFNKKPVSDNLVTQNGEHVRSKSELIIADRLKAAGVAYYYEDPIIMSDGELDESGFPKCLYWHPDFRVQNVRTGKQYFWEHFGLLDNSDYCAGCQRKLETYAHYGYYPGENLIITSESSLHSINLEYVDCLIERYLK